MERKRRLVPFVALAVASLCSATAGQSITVVNEHPRLVFRIDGTPGARTFQAIRDLYNSNGGSNPFHDEVQSWLTDSTDYTPPVTEASRYVITGDLARAENSLDAMRSGSLGYSGEGAEVGVRWALAYDWIHDAWEASGSPPPNLAGKLGNIEGKIAGFVSSALSDLDSSSPSLWHGRASIGAAAWVAALALPAGNATYDGYRSRAFDHWQQTLKATHASGGWPEGPTYWATNRAINFPTAYQCYESAVSSAPSLDVADPLEDLRTLGLWQVYTERGDGSFNRYGDVSSQVNISNGTPGKGIDYYAQATGDGALAAFAEHARDYRYPLYHSVYRWMYPVGYDPNIPKPPGYDPANPEACLADALPNAMLFGRDAMGFAVMRQGWADGDTQISFKAGDYLAHHGHCDQGTFTLFKHDKLVINSGGYGDYFGDHRLNYYVRTVSKNSILVQRPDEQWTPSGVAPPGGYVNDGGQRIVNETGSAVRSYESWLANKTSGPNYEQGDITAFQNADEEYTYIGSDFTRAYNSTLYDSEGQGGKVSQVTRQLVYLHDNDILVVFDRVASTDASYKKKWLLHTPNKMLGGTEVVAVGSADNGIMTVDGDTIAGDELTMTNGGGRLFLQVLLPASYNVHKVGGTDYRYYVEDDGNDADGFDGSNHDGGYTSPKSWHDYGDWRIEISPKTSGTFDTFLNVLTPRSSSVASVASGAVLRNDLLATVMQIEDQVLAFGTAGPIDCTLTYGLPAGGAVNHLVVDLSPDQLYRIASDSPTQYLSASGEGVLCFSETAAGAHAVTVAVPHEWNLPGGGSYNVAGHWRVGAVPDGADAVAEFFAALAAPGAVSVDAPVAVGALRFDNANGYTVAGPATVTFQTSAGNAEISVQSGGHNISAPLTLAGDLDIDTGADSLMLSGSLDNSAGRTLTKAGAGSLTVSGPQSHGVGSTLEADAGTTTFNSDAGAGGANLTVNVNDSAEAHFGVTQHLAALNVGRAGESDTAAAHLDGGVLVTDALHIDNDATFTSSLDVHTRHLVVDYAGASPIATIEAMVASGANTTGGVPQYDGPGIMSTECQAAPNPEFAVGVADNATLTALGIGITNFGGTAVETDDVLVRYTYQGDATLNGVTDGMDYALIDYAYAGGAGSSPIWMWGDFNYDGAIDGMDYALIDFVYAIRGGGGGLGPLGGDDDPFGGKEPVLITPAPVPEPGTLVVLAVGAVGAVGRSARRRRCALARRGSGH